jgi:hypothetical protein
MNNQTPAPASSCFETVPEDLVAGFSTRSRHIDAETDRLIEQYVSYDLGSDRVRDRPARRIG